MRYPKALKFFLSPLLLLYPIPCLVAQEPSRVANGVVSESAQAVDDPNGLRAWFKHGFTMEQRQSLREPFEWGMQNQFIPGGALLVMHHGEVVFREAIGLADIESNQPFTVGAPCRIASVTKPHTSTLVAMLVDQGKLAWDDPIDKYLPKFSKLTIDNAGLASRPPKIRELLSHTAGFPGNDERRTNASTFKIDGSLADAVDDLANAGLAAEPGTVYTYTGLGYMVAGRIAEVVSGQEFGALMNERLLKPVGAKTATFYSAATEELKSQMPTMYQRDGGRLVKADLSDRSEANVAFPMPGGGLISTVDDVARVMLLHRDHGMVSGKSLIAKVSLDALYRPQPATGRIGYGLGFNIIRKNSDGLGDRIRHTGASGTFVLLDFRIDFIVVMLSQVPSKQTLPFSNRLMKAVDSVFLQPMT